MNFLVWIILGAIQYFDKALAIDPNNQDALGMEKLVNDMLL